MIELGKPTSDSIFTTVESGNPDSSPHAPQRPRMEIGARKSKARYSDCLRRHFLTRSACDVRQRPIVLKFGLLEYQPKGGSVRFRLASKASIGIPP